MPEQLIMVVDDDEHIRRIVAFTLVTSGYKVIAAKGGREALRMARRQYPQLIILDVMMPDMDGFRVAHRLQRDQRTQSIPIIFLTARSQGEDILAGYKAGADWYITKPFERQELVSAVGDILSLRPEARAKRAQRILQVIQIEMKRKKAAEVAAGLPEQDDDVDDEDDLEDED